MRLRVLSLDGGGCRGYLSLLILKDLLRAIQADDEPIYPYRYFDIICGTSTGGLIALLLGVLHLDIDKAITLYEELAGKIFAKGFSKHRYFRKDAGYSRKPLEAAIDRMLNEYGEGRTLMVDQDKDKGCRVSYYPCIQRISSSFDTGLRYNYML
jgi:patatin-like phospholipase/acyl hydrolase